MNFSKNLHKIMLMVAFVVLLIIIYKNFFVVKEGLGKKKKCETVCKQLLRDVVKKYKNDDPYIRMCTKKRNYVRDTDGVKRLKCNDALVPKNIGNSENETIKKTENICRNECNSIINGNYVVPNDNHWDGTKINKKRKKGADMFCDIRDPTKGGRLNDQLQHEGHGFKLYNHACGDNEMCKTEWTEICRKNNLFTLT